MRGRYRYLHRRAVLYSLFYICYLKRAADDATSFFQSYPVSKALSFLVAVVTYLYEGVSATSIVVLSFIFLFLHLSFRDSEMSPCGSAG